MLVNVYLSVEFNINVIILCCKWIENVDFSVCCFKFMYDVEANSWEKLYVYVFWIWGLYLVERLVNI